MLSKKIENALSEQIKYEYYSSYLYLAMSAYCDSLNMPGFASWMRKQSDEEMTHALKLFDYVLNRDGNVKLKPIPEPPQKYTSLEKIFKQVYEHEIEVTGLINKLYELANKENDHATAVELQWFISEQVEEERTSKDFWEKLKLAGNNSSALLILDRELSQRQE
jgi:ferritin